ncbi:MAG: CDF family Co(II)/Ni(II) efflux transporter DmeF [Pseudomonadota bacterium]|nr:CDF family Co(II)/Ni(II) efflux transporter DmeF [Pseudomonadota bacterium]MDE3037084.1 CDF family Co(II)/Ni(II) efflux transporter DmeF [Pseudomonadota bacterium]
MPHIHDTSFLEHDHHYVSGHELHSERRTMYVVSLTAAMMLLEIVCGYVFNSMALLADGWHMSTHAGALGIAAFAYVYARRQARNPRFTFGTGKVGALGGFTSAIILAMIALLVISQSLSRLHHAVPIVYDEAIVIAVVGLGVNLLSAWLLRENHHHHDHEHDRHHDHNLRAAYIHVLADAVTSILAIGALIAGKYLGWIWMDPVMGIVGSFIIAHWSIGLMRRTGAELLDQAPEVGLEQAIRGAIERDADNKVTDLHLWHIAPGKLSAIVSLVTDRPQPPKHYKALLREFHHLVHVTVEVNTCEAA